MTHQARILLSTVSAFFIALICMEASASAVNQSDSIKDLFKGQKGKIKFAISLQWEGEDLLRPNLESLRNFRERFDSISFFQFINPAYFTKSNSNPQDAKKKIAALIKPQDTIGLHLLGWKSLTKDAGVLFRDTPTFWGNKLTKKSCLGDCGHEVPLSVYSKEELVTLIKYSMNLLDTYGFRKPQAFMAGGWMATNQVLEAAVDTGFKYDFSGVPPHLIKDRIERYPLYRWVSELWSQTTAFSQPLPIPTRVGWITEIFNNAATLDYISTKEIVDLYKGYANLLKKNPENNYVIHIGLYQETAAKNLPKLEAALQKIFAHSAKNNISIGMLNLPNPDARSKPHITPATSIVKERNTEERVFHPSRDLDAH